MASRVHKSITQLSGLDLLLYQSDRRRVNAIPQARGLRTVGKYVAEMPVTHIALHFNPMHAKGAVFDIFDHIVFHRLGEAGPAGP